MNCQECCEELAAYIEGLLDQTRRGQMEAHMAECPKCRSELEEVRELTVRLLREVPPMPPVSLENVVMDRILSEQAIQLRRLKMRRRIRVLGMSGATAAAIALCLVGSFWLAQPAAAEKTAAEVLAQGAEAVPNPSSVHIVAKMRTLSHDNFSSIDPDVDLVRVEIWKQFGVKPKWRVEKPGRVAVMDGASTEMLIRPDRVVQFPHASQAAFDTHWLLALTNVQDMVTHELRAAQARKWELKVVQQTTASGDNLLVTVEAKSGLPADDYLKNKFFEDSDMRRVYRFDAKTKRLEGFDAYLHRSGGDVLILAVERIEYDKPFDPAVFVVKLPDTVSLYQEPQRLPDNAKYETMTPEQAARAFFEACGRKDWDEVRKFNSLCDERIKSYLGGLQVVRLGAPFKSMAYPGWFIPYEIKLPQKEKFVVSNDNPAKRYIVLDVEKPSDIQKYAKKLARLKKLPDNGKYEKMTPKEAAQAFFDAYARKDVAEVQKFLDGSTSDKLLKELMNVRLLADVHIGEPVLDKNTGTWHVPVEASVIKKWKLAMRSDNPAKRYVVDGGI
jgi:hypothetical protein